MDLCDDHSDYDALQLVFELALRDNIMKRWFFLIHAGRAGPKNSKRISGHVQMPIYDDGFRCTYELSWRIMTMMGGGDPAREQYLEDKRKKKRASEVASQYNAAGYTISVGSWRWAE